MVAVARVPEARASQGTGLAISVIGPLEGYQGEGFYLSYSVNNTGHDLMRVANVTLGLNQDNVRPEIDTGSLSPGQEYGETVWVQMPAEEGVGVNPVTVTFVIQSYNNGTGVWASAPNNPIVVSESLTVLPSPTVPGAIQLYIVLPISLSLAAIGTLLAVTPTIRKRWNRRFPSYSIALLSVAATFGSTLHLVLLRTASPCAAGIVAGGFPLPWLPLPYPPVGFYTRLPGCPVLVQPPTLLSPVFLLADVSFYALIILGIGLLHPRSRTVVKEWLRTFSPNQHH